jgi:hypothetical protein
MSTGSTYCMYRSSILFAFLHPPLSIANPKITSELPNDFPFPDPNFNVSPLFSHARRPLSFIFCHLLFLPPPPPVSIIGRPPCNFIFSLFASSTHQNRLVCRPSSSGLLLFVFVVCACVRLLSNHRAYRANLANGAKFSDGAKLARGSPVGAKYLPTELPQKPNLPMEPNIC